MSISAAVLSLIENIEPETAALAAAGVVLLAAAFLHAFYPPLILLGTLMCGASVGLRIGGGGGVEEIFVMVFAILAVITAAYFVVIRSSKYGWILREPISGGNTKKVVK